MEFNVTHETICVNKPIFDGNLEQTVELDYALPDYYPGIFKLLKCRVIPCIYACRTAGDKLVVDGVNIVKLWYVCEEKNQIHSIEQKLPFSKTADMNEQSENPVISYDVRCDYVNSRVVNPRRIDLRGAITIHVMVCNQVQENIVTAAQGAGVQLNHAAVCASGEHLGASKQFSVSDEIQVGANPPIGEVLTIETSAVAQDCKVIANKAITKGQAMVHLLYCSAGEDSSMEKIEATIPISQIVDMPGVDEEYQCQAQYRVTSCEFSVSEDGCTLRVELDLTVCTEAYYNKESEGVDDAFSTQYALDVEAKELHTERLVCMFDEEISKSGNLEFHDVAEVIDAFYQIDQIEGKVQGDGLTFVSNLSILALGLDPEGNPIAEEVAVPIEFCVDRQAPCDEPIIKASAQPISIDYSFDGQQLEYKVTFGLTGKVICQKKCHCITAITPDEEQQKEKSNRALTLYYPSRGESVWDIAKRYNTSLRAIVEENELEDAQQILPGGGMIFIPIVE